MLSCMTFLHGIYALMFQKFTHFGAQKLCRVVYVKIYLFISAETEKKLSNVGRI